MGAALKVDAEIGISGEDYTHLTRSLRAKIGEPLRLVGPDFSIFSGFIVAIDRHSATVRIAERLPQPSVQAPLALGLCAPSTDAFDAALDAAVQLGVTDFVPLLSSRSKQLDVAKMPRWQRIAKETCCQCLRARPPAILAPQPLSNFLAASRPGKRFLAWQGASPSSIHSLETATVLTLLIGPEGGFDQEELRMAKEQGWDFLQLGEGVLRVPVAVAAGLSVLNHLRSGARQ